LADGISSLAYGHFSIPARVHTSQAEDIAERVLTAAEAHHRHMPFANGIFFPLGQDPAATIRSARVTMAATMNAAASGEDSPLPSPPIEELLNFVIEDDDE
jgi:hypothetical protein